MKYVYILLVVIMLVRIDLVIHGIETLMSNIKSSSAPAIATPVLPQPDDLISIQEGNAVNLKPRSVFFSLLDDFHTNPTAEVRASAINVLMKNPTIFGPKLDRTLEGEIFKLSDLIYNKNKELPNFLMNLTELLKDENLEMVNRFFTIMLDSNPEMFLRTYTRSKDTNCIIAGLLGHRVPDEELVPEYREREEILNEFMAKEKVDPVLSALAQKCLLVVKLQINKLAPEASVVPEAPAPESVQP